MECEVLLVVLPRIQHWNVVAPLKGSRITLQVQSRWVVMEIKLECNPASAVYNESHKHTHNNSIPVH